MTVNRLQIYETIFSQSPISTQIFSPNGDTLRVNEAWEKLWGIKFSKLKQYNVLKDKQLVKSGIMPYIKRGFKGESLELPAIKYVPSETVNVKGAVPYRWVSAIIYPVLDENNTILGVVLQHLDITEQKSVQETLSHSEERLRLALNAGEIGVWDWNIAENTLEWSDRVYEIHNVRQSTFEVTLDNFRQLIHPDDRKWVKKSLDEAIENKQPFKASFRIVTPEGEVKWIATRAEVFHDEQGNPLRMLGATTDITNQKHLENQKDEFIGIASHELKTPITSVKAYGQFLRNHFKRTEDTRSVELLSKMDGQIDKLTHLISDLLDVTKIQAGKLRLNKESFDFNELVREVTEQVQMTFASHTIKLKLGRVQMIEADRDRVGQVIINFLTNAIKYSPQADTVIVSTKSQRDHVLLSIQDFGAGISGVNKAKVFDRFYRVEKQPEKVYGGLGLGLYISKEIIERHNGTIGVFSKKGKGSTFYFSLPS